MMDGCSLPPLPLPPSPLLLWLLWQFPGGREKGERRLCRRFFYLSSNLPPRSLARSQEIGKSITRETPGDGPILPESRCC